MRLFKRKIRSLEIAPDEIFLDSRNLPEFDRLQFEGRIERPISKIAVIFLGAFFALALGLFSLRAVNLQIVNGQAFQTRAESNRLDKIPIFADRGVIYDRNKIPLVWNEPFSDAHPNDAVGQASSTATYAKRTYTAKPGFAHILGYVQYPSKDALGIFYSKAFEGKAGVEKSYGELLAG